MYKKAINRPVISVFIFILLLLLIFLFWYLQIPGKVIHPMAEKQTIKAEITNDATLVLLNYLRTPIILDNKEIDMTDLIILWQNNKEKYSNILNEETKEIFGGVYGYCYTFNIYDNEQKYNFGSNQYMPGDSLTQVRIPTKEGDLIVELNPNQFFSRKFYSTQKGGIDPYKSCEVK